MRLLVLLLLAANALAEVTPYSVAKLVHKPDEAALSAALKSPAPLVRATAARVIAVSGLTALLPALRETLAGDTDATAVREEIRALALLGNDDDLAAAIDASARWPEGMDDALAVAVARRGGVNAINAYLAKIRATRMRNTKEYFRVALWRHPDLRAFAGSRLLGAGDERGWHGLLGALEDSSIAMNPGVLTSSLGAASEDIRTASVWYLVRSYAFDPKRMNELVVEKVKAPRSELSSNREDFGLELLRRMLGGEKKDDPRWLEYLATDEADRLMGNEATVLQYLTEEEYRVRYNRCEIQMRECWMPSKKSRLTIPSQTVAPPAFNLPELLPAGLAGAITSGAKCRDSWLGVATATVDPAGRVMKLDLADVETQRGCKDALDAILRLSMATNTSLVSPLSGPVLLVHSHRSPLCLDEPLPEAGESSTLRVDSSMQAPIVRKRVEPVFPESARRAMGGGRNVVIVLECVISRDGCVRSVRVLSQSPYPQLNGAAVMAVSQWQFTPGYQDGKPVDVIFNLTINFKVG